MLVCSRIGRGVLLRRVVAAAAAASVCGDCCVSGGGDVGSASRSRSGIAAWSCFATSFICSVVAVLVGTVFSFPSSMTTTGFAHATAPKFCLISPNSFHSSTTSRSASTIASRTSPGNFLPPLRRPHMRRAFSSVAQSTARKGIRFALRMVSRREVAVMMWEEPAVREVNR